MKSHGIVCIYFAAAMMLFASVVSSQEADPCAGVACSGHGRCIPVEGHPACACEAGYIPDDTRLNCLAVQSAPQPVAVQPSPPPQGTSTAPQPGTTAPFAQPEVSPTAQPVVPGVPTTTAPQGSMRRIEVRSNPPGVIVSMDSLAGFRGPLSAGALQTTPFTFEASDTAHSINLDARGYERATIPVEAGAQDLLVDVDMSRPVFEAGIGLTVVGGVLATAGIVLLGIGAAEAAEEREGFTPGDHGFETVDEYCEGWTGEQNCWDDFYIKMGAGFLGLGSGFLIPGILMMALDRQRDATHTTSVVPESQ